MSDGPFKTCKVCDQQWGSRDLFIEDQKISLIGYQVNIMAIEKGLFLFNHTCGATLSILAEEFTDLYNGPIFVERKYGGEECPGHCLHLNDLRPCPSRCDCAYVRHVIQYLQQPLHVSR